MKKFCLSYSSGKDCLLAMDRLVQAGNQPVALVTTLRDRKSTRLNSSHIL